MRWQMAGVSRQNHSRRLHSAAVAVTLAFASLLRAQSEPNVAGVVKSVGGIPIAGIEVRIEGTNLATRTDTRGAFAFVGAPQGGQELLFRGIGYMPQKLAVRVPEKSLELAVSVLPAPSLLDTVKVREHINVLSGIVVDELSRPVPGATIEVITGERKTLTSDEDGWFMLTSLRDGVTVFRTKKDGYYMTNTAVRMDDWRGIVIHLETLPSNMKETAKAEASGTSNNSAAAWRDAGQRISMRGTRAVIISSEELAPFADMTLGTAIGLTKSGALLAIELDRARSSICVMQDGRRPVGNTSLDTWRAGDVDMIELYPPNTESSGTAQKYMRGAGCRSYIDRGRTRGPFYAVLWMR